MDKNRFYPPPPPLTPSCNYLELVFIKYSMHTLKVLPSLTFFYKQYPSWRKLGGREIWILLFFFFVFLSIILGSEMSPPKKNWGDDVHSRCRGGGKILCGFLFRNNSSLPTVFSHRLWRTTQLRLSPPFPPLFFFSPDYPHHPLPLSWFFLIWGDLEPSPPPPNFLFLSPPLPPTSPPPLLKPVHEPFVWFG